MQERPDLQIEAWQAFVKQLGHGQVSPAVGH
jgi:hypothetical protein